MARGKTGQEKKSRLMGGRNHLHYRPGDRVTTARPSGQGLAGATTGATGVGSNRPTELERRCKEASLCLSIARNRAGGLDHIRTAAATDRPGRSCNGMVEKNRAIAAFVPAGSSRLRSRRHIGPGTDHRV